MGQGSRTINNLVSVKDHDEGNIPSFYWFTLAQAVSDQVETEAAVGKGDWLVALDQEEKGGVAGLDQVMGLPSDDVVHSSRKFSLYRCPIRTAVDY